jgi:hypothetical protein
MPGACTSRVLNSRSIHHGDLPTGILPSSLDPLGIALPLGLYPSVLPSHLYFKTVWTPVIDYLRALPLRNSCCGLPPNPRLALGFTPQAFPERFLPTIWPPGVTHLRTLPPSNGFDSKNFSRLPCSPGDSKFIDITSMGLENTVLPTSGVGISRASHGQGLKPRGMATQGARPPPWPKLLGTPSDTHPELVCNRGFNIKDFSSMSAPWGLSPCACSCRSFSHQSLSRGLSPTLTCPEIRFGQQTASLSCLSAEIVLLSICCSTNYTFCKKVTREWLIWFPWNLRRSLYH